MRSEFSELRLITGASKKRRLSNQIAAPAVQDNVHDRDALDVAFENFTRIDVGVASNRAMGKPTPSNAMTTKAIVADIAAQLDALDRQRQRLSELLRNVSI